MVDINGQVGETDSSSLDESNETVPVIEATDEDLEAYLSRDEDSEDFEEEDQTGEGEDEEESEPLAEKKETAEATQTDSNEQKAPEVEELRAKNEKLSRQLETTEAFVQRRNNEIGDLRKKLTEYKEKLEANLEMKHIEDPKGAMKDTLELEKIESSLDELNTEEEANSNFVIAQKFIAKNLKEDEMDVDAMCAVLEADGANPEYIRMFRANPIQSARPTEIVQLGKRASERARLAKAVGFLRNLYEENQALKAAAKQNPKKMLNRIQKNLASSPGLSGAKATRAIKSSVSVEDLTDIDDNELEALLKKAE